MRPLLLKKTRTQHRFLPEIQTTSIRFRPSPAWLAEIRDCLICGPDIAVSTKSGVLLSDVSLAWEDKVDHYPIFRSPVFKKPLVIQGEAALLAVTGGDTYFHWLLEALPRLRLLEKGKKLHSRQCLIVNDCRPGFQKESLKIFGLNLANIINLRTNPHLLVQRAIIPSYPCHYGTPSREDIEFLRERLKKPVCGQVKKEKRKNRYLLRRKTGCRRLLYEKRIEEALKPHGFQAVEPEKLSLGAQIALFDQAEAVIAPHGAGLANMIFCRPGTKILEMFSGSYVNLCYQHLAGNCDLPHFSIHPWSQREKLIALDGRDRTQNGTDIAVGPEDILPVLEQARLKIW